MAHLKRFSPEGKKKALRHFSEEIKKKAVSDLENNLVTVSELSRNLSVSRTTLYSWVYNYSPYAKRGARQIVEMKSDTKKIKILQERIKELERVIGQKQLQIDFKDKMIEIAEKEYQVDIKKKLGSKPSSGSGKTGKRADTQ